MPEYHHHGIEIVCSAATAGGMCGVPGCTIPAHRQRLETTLPLMLQPDTEKALRTAGRKVAEWTAERDRLVKQAVKEGGSLREVGTCAGISHTAVKFIAHGRPSP